MSGNSALDNIQRGYGLGTLFSNSNTDQNAYTKALQGVDSSYYTPEVSKAIAQGYDNLGSNNQETGMFGGIGDYLNKLGITSKDGDIFGINKAQQKGLGQLAGLGSGLWNMYSANRNYGMAKDYYNRQNALQDEQMDRVRKEDARMEGLRSGLSKRYGE